MEIHQRELHVQQMNYVYGLLLVGAIVFIVLTLTSLL